MGRKKIGDTILIRIPQRFKSEIINFRNLLIKNEQIQKGFQSLHENLKKQGKRVQ